MYKILLVEDDRNTLEGLANILEQEGYEVVKAIDGATAVREVKSSVFNLILTDLLLPDFDGSEVAKQAWKEQPDIIICICGFYFSLF